MLNSVNKKNNNEEKSGENDNNNIQNYESLNNNNSNGRRVRFNVSNSNQIQNGKMIRSQSTIVSKRTNKQGRYNNNNPISKLQSNIQNGFHALGDGTNLLTLSGMLTLYFIFYILYYIVYYLLLINIA